MVAVNTGRERSVESEVVPRSVERVLDLLEIVLAEPGATLSAAAGEAGLTPTTALRYLRALEARGYVERDGQGAFGVGPTMMRLASVLSEQGPLEQLVATAQPRLDALAAACGESCYLVVSDGRVATYVATAESPRAIRHVGWIGQVLPLDGTAAGAAMHEPGAVKVRTGAVEPDITAVSVALPIDFSMGVALSVVGPEQRLDAHAQQQIAAELDAAASALVDDLRIGPAKVGR